MRLSILLLIPIFYGIFLGHLEGAVITFPLDALDPRDPSAGLKRAKRISAHTSFFKAGHCLNRTLVCVVKSSQLSSTIKVLEPIDYTSRGKSKPTFRKLLQGGNDTLRLFRVRKINSNRFCYVMTLVFCRSSIYQSNPTQFIS